MTDKLRNILGIESSCDETACAIVRDSRDVLASSIASQIDLHARFGGIVPELASRAHIEAINTVIDQALSEGQMKASDIDAIAVTCQPGLIGSLLVGLMAAKTLAWLWQKPLVGVNHVYAHAYAAALDDEPIPYPSAALICSGGHTALYHCTSPTQMTLLGTTLDDAAGEAFDKVANILQLGYPGGPAIDKTAVTGNPKAIAFPRPLLHSKNLDFSFSGIKTAVLYHVNGKPTPKNAPAKPDAKPQSVADFSPAQIANIAASFQAAAVDVLQAKLKKAALEIGAKSIILGGGVAANSALRTAAQKLAETLNIPLRKPPLKFCVDNAAMIAGLGFHELANGKRDSYDLPATPTVRM